MSSSVVSSSESKRVNAFAITGESAANSMAFSMALNIEEFICANDLYGEIIKKRCQEVRLPPSLQSYLADYPDWLYLIVLATPEDPDSVSVLPVLDALVNAAPRLSMRIARDDDDLTLLDNLLEDVDLLNEIEELDLPQAFFFDEEWQLVEQWGPRPLKAEPYLDAWLERHPDYETLAESDDIDQDAYGLLLEELTYEMRVWYNSGLNDACAEEVRQLLVNARTDDMNSAN